MKRIATQEARKLSLRITSARDQRVRAGAPLDRHEGDDQRPPRAPAAR